MSELLPDQTAEGWNQTSQAYNENLWNFMAPYVREIVTRACPGRDHQVLDVAAGTGAVSLAVAPQVGRVLAVDFADEMLSRLERNAKQAGVSNVQTEVMDGQALKLDDESFDVVCSNFGVIFFPDRIAGFSEMRRVLRPGARAVFTAWSTPDRFEMFHLFLQAVKRAVPDLPEPPQPPPVFSLSDPLRIEQELRTAGFENIQIDTVQHSHEEASMQDFWNNTNGSAPPLVALLEKLGPEGAERVKTSLLDIGRERFGDGPVSLTNEAHVAVATR